MTKYLPSFVMNDMCSHFNNEIWNLLYGSDPFLSEQSTSTYPKYDIIKDKDNKNVSHIVMAVAGLDKTKIKVTTLKNKLSVTYEKPEEDEGAENNAESGFIVRHISNRSFTQMFTAPEGYEIKVLNAKIEDGLLTLDVESIIPDDLKEKEIDIKY